MYDDEFRPRLKAADLEKLAATRLAEYQAAGEELHPVVNKTRKLTRNFWGSAWMKQLALCESGGMCLAPGRTLLRHACVLHVDIQPGSISALVSAEEVFEVELKLEPLDEERLERLAATCSGHIDSLLSLMQGKVDEAVLQQLCHPEDGLLPTPEDWRMHCTCPDWAEPCPHTAAAIYAAGCLIDEKPELLFTLRGIQPEALLSAPAPANEIDADKLSAMFGIDLDLG
ncbi:MAG: hypothetical protein IKW48_05925 [Akkermansia sp.]|nr:hypothetical protein [Akkermansia sp.]